MHHFTVNLIWVASAFFGRVVQGDTHETKCKGKIKYGRRWETNIVDWLFDEIP